MSTDKSLDAIENYFPEFIKTLRDRLEIGRLQYGDVSFEKSTGQLACEIEQELWDVVGWGFILSYRIQELKRKLSALEQRAKTASGS